MISKLVVSTVALSCLLLSSCSSLCYKSSDSQKAKPVSLAVRLESPLFAKGRVYQEREICFAGQPTEEGLQKALASGTTKVINLRTAGEMNNLGWSEEKLIAGSAGRYVFIPVSPKSFSMEDVKKFASEFDSHKGPILIHCASSNRVGAMWAAYLVRYRNFDMETAMEHGKAAGMSSDSMIEAFKRVVTSK